MRHMIPTSLAELPKPSGPPMVLWMEFGIIAVLMTLVACFAFSRHPRRAALPISVCLAATAIYAIVEGAWPIGIVCLIWSAGAVEYWRRTRPVAFLYGRLRQSHSPYRVRSMFGEAGLN